ncbi:MAG: DEAD/DEAH box helicase, partial [Betaproteobacteria bacterium]|nr:DEAD/DEAH box helicase [Betaproteobacteria bacterium]
SPDQFFGAARQFGRITMRRVGASSGDPNPVASADTTSLSTPSRELPDLSIERRAEDPVAALRAFVQRFTKPVEPAHAGRILILAESAGRRETLMTLFAEAGLAPHPLDTWGAFLASDCSLALGIGPLTDGFWLPQQESPGRLDQSSVPGLDPSAAPPLAIITEGELFRGTVRRRGRGSRGQQTNVDAIVRDLSELKIGDPVVHAHHGIGRYCGLITMDLGDGAAEFLELIYANQTKLFVPVSALQLIGRYTGAAPEDAPLHALGSGQWEKARRKAAAQARDTAAELLNLYARRAARSGHAFRFDAKEYEAFAQGFGFEETPDQLAAIHATIQDLVSGKPMDRLVCGDVGFGKTEVALRAAFIAVADGKQVAILVPTTLLAEQHYESVSSRFADLPVKVAELSRFRNPKEIKAALAGLADGTIDIVIGTHKLLAKDVQFKRLGLLIIDEEHRFGVRQKEALKNMRAEV